MTATSPAPENPKPRSLAFRKRYTGPRISPDCAKRQADIANLAFTLLGGRDPAVAFLNFPDDDLGARPLDLATATSEGYAQVAEVLHAMANVAPGDEA